MVDVNLKQEHFDEFHAKAKCPQCQTELEKNKLAAHMPVCPMRKQKCDYCSLDFIVKDFAAHVKACGSRTRNCEHCDRIFMLREIEGHEMNCLEEQARERERRRQDEEKRKADAERKRREEEVRQRALAEQQEIARNRAAQEEANRLQKERDLREIQERLNRKNPTAAKFPEQQRPLLSGNTRAPASNMPSRSYGTGGNGATRDPVQQPTTGQRIPDTTTYSNPAQQRPLSKAGQAGLSNLGQRPSGTHDSPGANPYTQPSDARGRPEPALPVQRLPQQPAGITITSNPRPPAIGTVADKRPADRQPTKPSSYYPSGNSSGYQPPASGGYSASNGTGSRHLPAASNTFEDESEQLARLLQQEEDKQASEEFIKKAANQPFNRPTEEEDERVARELQQQFDRDTLANQRARDYQLPGRIQPTQDRRPPSNRANADAWLNSNELPIYDSDYPDAIRSSNQPSKQPQLADDLDEDEMLQAAILESAKQSQLQKNSSKRPR